MFQRVVCPTKSFPFERLRKFSVLKFWDMTNKNWFRNKNFFKIIFVVFLTKQPGQMNQP